MENPIPKTTLSRNRRSKGFTLIEILIVLTIIGMVLALGLPAIERVTYQQLNSTARKFVGTVRTVRNDAILLGTIYRLVIDFDKNAWWVESQKNFQLLTNAPPSKKPGKNDKPQPSNFEVVKKYSSKPVVLPSGLMFRSVLKETEGLKKEGQVYIHFFPNGFADASIIYLSKDGNAEAGYSLVIKPTAGQVDIERGYVTFN